MRWEDFERQIRTQSVNAPDAARRRFAVDTSRLLAEAAQGRLPAALSSDERHLLDVSLEAACRGALKDLDDSFATLEESIFADEYRAEGLPGTISRLLLALTHWAEYLRSGDPERIAGIAIEAVNAVDVAISVDTADYSSDNMFGDARMVAEWERQQRSLRVTEPVAAPDRRG